MWRRRYFLYEFTPHASTLEHHAWIEAEGIFLQDNFNRKCRRLVPPEPRVFFHPNLHLAHIKSTDDWTRMEYELEKWLNHHPLLSFREMTLFSPLLYVYLASLHMAKAEKRKAASDVWKAIFAEIWQKNPSGDFPFCATRFSPTWTDCLRKTAPSMSCFFIDRTWKIFSENEPFFTITSLYVGYVQIPLDIQIFSFTELWRRWRCLRRRKDLESIQRHFW